MSYKFVFAFLLSVCAHAQNCLSVIKQIKSPWVKDEVSVVFFPGKWHTEIEVSGKLYNPKEKFRKKRHMKTAKERSLDEEKHFEFVRFPIKVKKEELVKIKKMIRANESRVFLPTCVGNVCHVLDKSGAMHIPFPFSELPLMNAAYLYIQGALKLPFSRVQKVEIYGSKKLLLEDLKASAKTEHIPAVLGAMGLAAIGAGAVVVVTIAGSSYIIPVEEDK